MRARICGVIVAVLASGLAVAGPVSLARADKRGAQLLGQVFRAFRAGDFPRARRLRGAINRAKLLNQDYADYALGQAAFLLGEYGAARIRFTALVDDKSSRFNRIAHWRLADCEWALGNLPQARQQYEDLVRAAERRRHPVGDVGVALYRIGEAWAAGGNPQRAVDSFRKAWTYFPTHPIASRARERARVIGGDAAADLTWTDRIDRADNLLEDKLWREAVAELDKIQGPLTAEEQDTKNMQLGRTLFKMRRQYPLAARIFLDLWPRLEQEAPWTLYHAARAFARVHKDREAIRWYQKLIDTFPNSAYADESHFMLGWFEFALDRYQTAIPHLERAIERYPRRSWVPTARWYLGFAHYLMGQYEEALPYFDSLTGSRDRLQGGKGRYWRARALFALDRADEAKAEYRAIISRWPFSWYALLARSRLGELNIDISPFGDPSSDSSDVPQLDTTPSKAATRDPLIAAVDELIAAGLRTEAGYELRRGERGLFRRLGSSDGLAVALDRYRRAGNFNRPWMLAVVRGGRALSSEPKGAARAWWQHAYPLAYEKVVEKWQSEANTPKYYLFSIMRKESGFDPHTLSHANALGLLQMIPPTTRRVAAQLGLEYSIDLLYDPDTNIRMGSWYIGRLLEKFKNQIPVGAASFNAGPAAAMRWLRRHGKHPIDEYVELITHKQARGYGKKVTETYARYLYLYEGEIYKQPLELDADYIRNELIY